HQVGVGTLGLHVGDAPVGFQQQPPGLVGGPARHLQQAALHQARPKALLARSDMRSGVQGGIHTRLTRASRTPSTDSTARRAASRIWGAAGQPRVVSVMSMSTTPSSLMSSRYTRPRSTMLMGISGSLTCFRAASTCSRSTKGNTSALSRVYQKRRLQVCLHAVT